MKQRRGFVSNSSSSSFVFYFPKSFSKNEKVRKQVMEAVEQEKDEKDVHFYNDLILGF